MTAQPTPARHHQTTEKFMNSALFWILLVEDSFRGFTVGGLPRITVSAVVGDLRGTKIMCQLTYYYGKMVLYKICSMWCLVMHLYKKWQKQIGCFFLGGKYHNFKGVNIFLVGLLGQHLSAYRSEIKLHLPKTWGLLEHDPYFEASP